MPAYVKNSGSWQNARYPSAKISTAWKNITAGWCRVAGSWRQFYVRDNTGPTTPTPTVAWNQAIPGFNVTFGATTDETGVASVTLQVRYDSGAWATVATVSAAGATYQHAITTGNRGRLVEYRLVAVDTVGNTTNGTASTAKYAKPLGSFGITAIDSGSWAQHVLGNGYSPGGWRNTFLLHSGRWDAGTYGHQVGLWFYGTGVADICKGYAPDVASIYMERNGSSGSSGHNNIAPHGYTTKPAGVPTIGGGEAIPGPYTYEDQGPSLSGANDFEVYAIPGTWLTLMGNGTLKGVATVDSGNPPGDEGSLGSYRVLKGIDTEVLSGFLTLEFD